MSNLRFKVVEEAFKKRPVEVATPAERPSEYFAKYVFNQEKMFKYLPLKTYKRLREAIEQGTPLPMSVADEVAQGMKQWAMSMGVTHCTHGFQPLTEGTAELPQRRYPLHLRGTRLLCLGSRFARVHHRRHFDDPHGVYLLHRRGTRL